MRDYAKKSCFARIFSIVVATMCLYASCCGEEFAEELDDEEDASSPNINLSIIVKNHEHSLPYFLTLLERLNYPKDRLCVCFYLEHNERSKQIIDVWAKIYQAKYKKIIVDMMPEHTPGRANVFNIPGIDDKEDWDGIPPVKNVMRSNEDDIGARAASSLFTLDRNSKWSEERMERIISLREKALNFSRNGWADFLFMLDADVLLTDKNVLKRLIKKKLPVVAPMLKSEGEYTNFWGELSEGYWYARSSLYDRATDPTMPALEKGCHNVPMVHAAVLIYLRMPMTQKLTYTTSDIENYHGPEDDIIILATSANWNNIPMYICNEHEYGYVATPMDVMSYEGEEVVPKGTDKEHFLNIKIEAICDGSLPVLDPELEQFVSYPEPDRLGLDKVFIINLERRPERRNHMERAFRELGIDAEFTTAVDGRTIRMDSLDKLSVRLLPAFEDPHAKRPMKAGEVGCFLSHYNIWKEIAKHRIPVSMVLEDDVRFMPFFRRRFNALMKDLSTLEWDMVYIGRKAMTPWQDELVTSLVVKPTYSYWTLGYIITEAGARKLINAEPLTKMLPVDEFLPIMFNVHPNDTWKQYFRQRDLKVLSATPVLVKPLSYTGEKGYVSDTEDSSVLAEDVNNDVDGDAAATANVDTEESSAGSSDDDEPVNNAVVEDWYDSKYVPWAQQQLYYDPNDDPENWEDETAAEIAALAAQLREREFAGWGEPANAAAAGAEPANAAAAGGEPANAAAAGGEPANAAAAGGEPANAAAADRACDDIENAAGGRDRSEPAEADADVDCGAAPRAAATERCDADDGPVGTS